MRRKRRQAAPAFKQPVPYSPISGERAEIGTHGITTRVAMAQVIEEDTHDNYIECRLFDPEVNKLLSTVNVAKPYGLRGTNPYVVGQVFAAMKPRTVLGDTPGVAETTVGHPADLDETVEILEDDDGNPVAWLDIGTLGTTMPPAGCYNFSKDRQVGDASTGGYINETYNVTLWPNYTFGNFARSGLSSLIAGSHSYGDGFLETLVAGTWEFFFSFSLGPFNETIGTSTYNTSTADGHFHTYEHIDWSSYPSVEGWLAMEATEEDESWTEISEIYTGYMSFLTPELWYLPAVGYCSLPAGSQIRLKARVAFHNAITTQVASGASGFGMRFIDNTYDSSISSVATNKINV